MSSSLLLPALEVETGHTPDATVIWLHGLGADGHDFEPVIPEFKLPETLALRFIFPHAPARPVTLSGVTSCGPGTIFTKQRCDDESILTNFANLSERWNCLSTGKCNVAFPPNALSLQASRKEAQWHWSWRFAAHCHLGADCLVDLPGNRGVS